MMKCEFEERVGKEVDYEVFEMYEAMYMAVDLDKDAFCALLDKDAIPESKASQEAKIRNAQIVAQVRVDIDEINAKIKDAEEWVDYYKWCIQTETGYGDELVIRSHRRQIKAYQETIAELKRHKTALKKMFGIR